MLVLTRKAQEQIQIGHNIKVTVVRVQGRSVRLGIEAPGNVRIVRGELAAAMAEFRDEESADGPAFGGGGLEEATHEPGDARLSADDEDETRIAGAAPPSRATSPLPLGRAPGQRRCQLRRPPRLGPAAFRSLSCR